jgi:glycerophosphoryl diester phosphodiesterase
MVSPPRTIPQIDSTLVERLRATGKELHVWTVDFLADARHYHHLGVASLLSNRPGFLRQGLFAESL